MRSETFAAQLTAEIPVPDGEDAVPDLKLPRCLALVAVRSRATRRALILIGPLLVLVAFQILVLARLFSSEPLLLYEDRAASVLVEP